MVVRYVHNIFIYINIITGYKLLLMIVIALCAINDSATIRSGRQNNKI